MQLYIFPPSPNSLRCQAVANQLGIDLELVPLDLSKGAHMDERYVRLNPNHKIPTLVDRDFVLWESGAIMLYLAQMKPEAGLIPNDPQRRAKMAQWLFWNTAHFGPACGTFITENLVKKILNLGDPDPDALAKGKDEFARFAKVISDHLDGKDFVVGDSMSLADHAIASWFVHADSSGYPLAGFDTLTKWAGNVLESEPWRRALAVII
jgi:glutathione S-transferase